MYGRQGNEFSALRAIYGLDTSAGFGDPKRVTIGVVAASTLALAALCGGHHWATTQKAKPAVPTMEEKCERQKFAAAAIERFNVTAGGTLTVDPASGTCNYRNIERNSFTYKIPAAAAGPASAP